MLAKRVTRLFMVAMLVTVLGVLTPGLGFAAGTGPADALAPSGAMVHIASGAQQWYVFHIDGVDRDSTPANVSVMLQASPEGSAVFNVWTPDEIRALPGQDFSNPIQPIGRGTQETYKNGDETLTRYNGALLWADRTRVGGTFYVQVIGMASSDYRLSISGDNLSFPTQSMQPAPTVQTVQSVQPAQLQQPRFLPRTGSLPSTQASAVAAPQAAPAPSVFGGSSIDHPLAVTGQVMTVPSGQQRWFAIQVPGDSDPGDKPRVQVRLSVLSGGAASFTVWTRERLNEFNTQDSSTQKIGPVGVGSMVTARDSDNTRIPEYSGDLFWLGDARVGGTYYIVVDAAGSGPVVQYRLTTTLQ